MTLAGLYRYPTRHYRHHRQQLTLSGRQPGSPGPAVPSGSSAAVTGNITRAGTGSIPTCPVAGGPVARKVNAIAEPRGDTPS